MSGLGPLPPIDLTPFPAAKPDLMLWGAVIISALVTLAFAVALILAFIKGDASNLNLLIGAVIANTSSVISYWIGSSSGSRRKTDIIAGERR